MVNEKRGAALPLSPRLVLAVSLAASTALAGCTSDSALMPSPADIALLMPDPVLPEAIATPPQPRPMLSEDTATVTVAAAYAAPVAAPLAAAAQAAIMAPSERLGPQQVAARSPELDTLISRYSDHYGVPETLVRRVVNRESTFNPAARNGPYWGLMQILPSTARSMGYSGPNEGLLDAETNLKYAVRYLRGAWLTAEGNEDQAVRYYARGYYYDAKAKGLLDETGLGRDRRRMR